MRSQLQNLDLQLNHLIELLKSDKNDPVIKLQINNILQKKKKLEKSIEV